PSKAGSRSALRARRTPPKAGETTRAHEPGGDRHADGVDADVPRRPLAAAHERLVVLVGACVGQRDPDGPGQGPLDHAPQRPPPGRREQRVAADVPELPQRDDPPGVVSGCRLGRGDEDHPHHREREKEAENASIHHGAAAPGKRDAVISVTSKSRYAVVALAELARAGENPMPIGQVAERRGIPVQFLEQLFSTLRRAGILVSHRGAKGGYTLARPAGEITVLEV